MSVNLNAEVLERVQTIERKHKNVFETLLKELNAQVAETETQCRKAADLRDLYYQMSDNCSRSAFNLDKLLREFELKLITQVELESENRKYSELKIYSEEKRQEYEATVQLINAIWKKNQASVTQFFQTMNGVDRDRQVVIMGTAAALGSQFESMLKAVAGQRREVKNAVEKSLNASQKMSFPSVLNKVERLARMTLNLSKISTVEFQFVSFEDVMKEGGWRPKSALLEKSTAGELTDKDRADLFEIVDDLFSSQVMKTRVKLTDAEIGTLFGKEAAVVEFLVKAQKILSTEDFMYQMHESKFGLLTKIMRRAIDRCLTRNLRVRKFQGGQIRKNNGAAEPGVRGHQRTARGARLPVLQRHPLEGFRPVGGPFRAFAGHGPAQRAEQAGQEPAVGAVQWRGAEGAAGEGQRGDVGGGGVLSSGKRRTGCSESSPSTSKTPKSRLIWASKFFRRSSSGSDWECLPT